MNAQIIPNPKCSKCYCYWEPNETDIKTSGLYYKTCKRCRVKRKETEECKCGGKYTITHRSRHLDTKQHKEFIENSEH